MLGMVFFFHLCLHSHEICAYLKDNTRIYVFQTYISIIRLRRNNEIPRNSFTSSHILMSSLMVSLQIYFLTYSCSFNKWKVKTHIAKWVIYFVYIYTLLQEYSTLNIENWAWYHMWSLFILPKMNVNFLKIYY